MLNSLDWIKSKSRRFNDILVTALSPIRRGPGSYQYRVKLKRRGPAVKHPPGSFFPVIRGARTPSCLVESHSTPLASWKASVGTSADAARKSACATGFLPLRDGLLLGNFLQAPTADGA